MLKKEDIEIREEELGIGVSISARAQVHSRIVIDRMTLDMATLPEDMKQRVKEEVIHGIFHETYGEVGNLLHELRYKILSVRMPRLDTDPFPYQTWQLEVEKLTNELLELTSYDTWRRK